MTKVLSRELRICLAIWRKAFDERNSGADPITINAANLNSAISIRQAMYRAVKPFRAGEAFDEDIRMAAELFVCFLEKQDDPMKPHRLILRPRNTLSALDAEMESLGLTEDDLFLAEEKAVNEKLTEFIGSDERPENPFYKR